MISYNISYHISSTGRRAVVTAAEMTEFEKQAECLGWAKVQVFKADHGENYSVLFFIGLCCNIETHHKYITTIVNSGGALIYTTVKIFSFSKECNHS